jgi:hypothetical protein
VNLTPLSPVVHVVIDLTAGTPRWDERFDVAWYVDRCRLAGFAETDDQMRACALRYLAGKRRVTPPGTARRRRDERRRRAELAAVPPELAAAVAAVVAENEKAVAQYRAGVEKAINALVGQVMRRHRADPAVVKTLLEAAAKA